MGERADQSASGDARKERKHKRDSKDGRKKHGVAHETWGMLSSLSGMRLDNGYPRPGVQTKAEAEENAKDQAKDKPKKKSKEDSKQKHRSERSAQDASDQ